MMDWTTSFSLPSQHLVKKNDLLTTLPTLSKGWRVTFDFYPTSYSYQGYAQILQMTTGGRMGKIGDRTPALWIHKTRGLYIATALNGKASVGKFFRTKKPSLKKWTSVEISQMKKGRVFIFSLIVKGETLWSVENSDPREFSDVKVFASSEWYEAQAGLIREFKIENMGSGQKQEYFISFAKNVQIDPPQAQLFQIWQLRLFTFNWYIMKDKLQSSFRWITDFNSGMVRLVLDYLEAARPWSPL